MDLSSLVLLLREDNQMAFFPAKSISASDRIDMELLAQDSEGRGFLERLQHSKGESVSIAYGTTANRTDVQGVVQNIENGAEVWKLELQVIPLQVNNMEVAFSSFSAEDIAAMRARRVLLNERLEAVPGDPMNQSMLDVFVAGMGTNLQINQSPLPSLYKSYGENPEVFLAVARLVSIALLKLSGTVDQVKRFECELTGNSLSVVFSGVRPRVYSNAEPSVITVEGICDLS